MIRTIAALVVLSAMTAVANAADTGTAPTKQRYVSPGIANVTASAAPRPESTASNARCRELAAGIDAVTHSPDRGQKIVRGMDGPGRQATQRTARLRQTGRSGSRAPAPRLPVTNNAAPAPTRPIRAGQRPYAFAPPSIVNPVPLIDRPSGPTTNATSAATSSALPYC
ncbi:hypothetical protein DM44_2488 [Burkholderia cepacia]|nr:hypothetical protein DM42_2690 [Burkholderia cepacia]KGB97097.1 hypothetical protein DM44_2488 [Burkholderia cepacia]